ncbi:N-acetyl-gamma-glutamyl-phosphate reductase [Clostridia bacterium]|nr:N-acetyl-gamma-glutamyl-phosphate reductase [Clostridia bacterium]
MVKVGIIGATGYAGAELVRILHNHSKAEIAAVASVSYEGRFLSSVFPHLSNICDDVLTSVEDLIEKCDVVFASVPHGVGEEIAQSVAQSSGDKLLIDLGADFRLEDEADYKEWYGGDYKIPALHKGAVYGLPEFFREQIKTAKIIANPGCYPTSIAIALYPLLKNRLIHTESIIIDSKSGVTGAGRGLTQNTHFPDTNEAFGAYKAACHRHTPEIEQTLRKFSPDKKLTVTFVPHLLPVNRGIESSVYVKYSNDLGIKDLHELYAKTYAEERFVRIHPLGAYSNIADVRGSNYCDISLHPDPRTGTLVVSSVIDNLVKGAAGQAVQNMNLALGIDEGEGLNLVPLGF